MKLARSVHRSSRRAFTMVEIALSLAIIAFAMVAILAVLPTGATFQRDNRENTIIGQEGAFWMEAIRGGAQFPITNDLADSVVNMWAAGQPILPLAYTNSADVIGQLSVPGRTNRAIVRATSGVVGEQRTEVAFQYELESQVFPLDVATNNFLPEVSAGISNHLHEIRLTLRWPVIGTNTATTTGKQVFRSMVSGRLADAQNNGLYFFQPKLFAQ
jgi:type II secretory pathway pseudopilin PulG